jgi:hypothetical protein
VSTTPKPEMTDRELLEDAWSELRGTSRVSTPAKRSSPRTEPFSAAEGPSIARPSATASMQPNLVALQQRTTAGAL